MKRIDDPFYEYELSSGRKVAANNGIIGLSTDFKEGIFGGYDEHVAFPDRAIMEDIGRQFTYGDHLEVALFMVDLWYDYAHYILGKEREEQEK